MNRGNIEKILRENSSGWLNEGEVQNITDLIIDEVNSWKKTVNKIDKKDDQSILPVKSKRNTIVAVKQADEISKPSTAIVLKPNGRVTPDNK